MLTINPMLYDNPRERSRIAEPLTAEGLAHLRLLYEQGKFDGLDKRVVLTILAQADENKELRERLSEKDEEIARLRGELEVKNGD